MLSQVDYLRIPESEMCEEVVRDYERRLQFERDILHRLMGKNVDIELSWGKQEEHGIVYYVPAEQLVFHFEGQGGDANAS